MEHIVQFAIGIDDDAIKKICENKASEQIIKDVTEFSHGKSYYGRLNDTPEQLKSLFVEAIDKYVKEHLEEVIHEAIKEVSKNIMKTKVVKEAISDMVEGK